MTEEAAAVQSNMNAFSAQIEASGIDVHVILVSSPLAAAGMGTCVDPTGIACIFVPGLNADGNGICLDPPLGAAGACPSKDDSNPATGYLHVLHAVASNDALNVLQSTFSSWQSMLRPDAVKTFIVVTDDEVRGNPTGDEFVTWVNSQPIFTSAKWRFSGVFCATNGANCSNVGATYSKLVSQTQGVAGDLALFGSGQVDAQFKAVTDSLADAIVRDAVPVDCAWKIPSPGDGKAVNPKQVNVHYTNTAGATQTIYQVNDAPTCTSDVLNWYYDDPTQPTQVKACPETCKIIQADQKARIDVLFGCDPERPPTK
jgi:hypothetical protein